MLQQLADGIVTLQHTDLVCRGGRELEDRLSPLFDDVGRSNDQRPFTVADSTSDGTDGFAESGLGGDCLAFQRMFTEILNHLTLVVVLGDKVLRQLTAQWCPRIDFRFV